MKKVIIIHGWDGTPDEPLHTYLATTLREKGYEVNVPAMPHPDEPEISSWIETIRNSIKNERETIFVGHSVGCQAILRYLETLPTDTHIEKVVLIAPWMELDAETIREEGPEVVAIADPWMNTPIDFSKLKSMIGKVVAIFSDNDVFVPLSQRDIFAQELNAEIITEHNQGHFTESDNFTELPSVIKAIIE